ncbi:Uncharacterised protein [Mycobacteroides abscessus subsp. abscessus]|nr:Uncharacterised protein [Mycobacteroides abscessus subsp. abscessus]
MRPVATSSTSPVTVDPSLRSTSTPPLPVSRRPTASVFSRTSHRCATISVKRREMVSS